MPDHTSDHISDHTPDHTDVEPAIRPDLETDTGAERRLHERETDTATSPTIDLGFGPVDILDWSFGGARLKGATLSLTVGEFATGDIALGTASGKFIADVVRIHPPYFDPQSSPDEISLRWLDLPPDVLEQMIAAKAAPASP